MTFCGVCAIIPKHSTSAPSYRGVEQLEARRAHNPEVVGSSPASATIKTPDFDKKSGVFLTFLAKIKNGVFRVTPILTPTPGQNWCCFMDILELLLNSI